MIHDIWWHDKPKNQEANRFERKDSQTTSWERDNQVRNEKRSKIISLHESLRVSNGNIKYM